MCNSCIKEREISETQTVTFLSAHLKPPCCCTVFFFFLSLFGNTNSKMSIFFSIYLFFLPIMANHDPKSSNWCIYYRLVKRTAAFECLCSHSLFLPASMHCLLVTSKQNNDSEWLSIIQSIQNRNV